MTRRKTSVVTVYANPFTLEAIAESVAVKVEGGAVNAGKVNVAAHCW